jgi:hypothetical protein
MDGLKSANVGEQAEDDSDNILGPHDDALLLLQRRMCFSSVATNEKGISQNLHW